MRYRYVLIILFFSLGVYGQKNDKSLVLKGKVVDSLAGLDNAYVQNISSKTFTITNAVGQFSITVHKDDTLQISHVGYEETIHIIDDAHFVTKYVEIPLIKKLEELTDVVVETSGINASSLNLPQIDEKYQDMTRSEKRLSSKKSFGRVEDIAKGGALFIPIEPLITNIFGSKKLKRKIEAENYKKDFDTLTERFYNYTKTTLKVPEDYVIVFMYYLVDNDKHRAILDAESEGMAEFYLTDAYVTYKNEIMQNKL